MCACLVPASLGHRDTRSAPLAAAGPTQRRAPLTCRRCCFSVGLLRRLRGAETRSGTPRGPSGRAHPWPRLHVPGGLQGTTARSSPRPHRQAAKPPSVGAVTPIAVLDPVTRGLPPSSAGCPGARRAAEVGWPEGWCRLRTQRRGPDEFGDRRARCRIGLPTQGAAEIPCRPQSRRWASAGARRVPSPALRRCKPQNTT